MDAGLCVSVLSSYCHLVALLCKSQNLTALPNVSLGLTGIVALIAMETAVRRSAGTVAVSKVPVLVWTPSDAPGLNLSPAGGTVAAAGPSGGGVAVAGVSRLPGVAGVRGVCGAAVAAGRATTGGLRAVTGPDGSSSTDETESRKYWDDHQTSQTFAYY